MNPNEPLELWTVQAQIVLDTLDRTGVYFVKREYVKQKYQDSAWIFQTAYDYFVKAAAQRVPKPEGAEYPVWAYRDAKWPFRSKGAFLLKLAVPPEEAVLFDLRDWSKILNLSYLGSEAETEQMERELYAQGIAESSEVFQRPFYPVQKRKIMGSWDRLLTKPLPADTYVQGALWRLRREWIDERISL